MTMAIDAHEPSPPAKFPRRRRLLPVGLVVAVIASVVVGREWAVRRNTPPFPASAVQATVSMTMVAADGAQRRIDELAGPGRMNAIGEPGGDGTELIGQLAITAPHTAADAQLALFVIDKRSGRPVPGMWGVGPNGSNVAQGWDGRYGLIAQRYPALSGLAAVEESGSFFDPGMAVRFVADSPAAYPGPVTFVATMPPDAVPVTDPATQLTVALALIGGRDDGPVYWVKQLTP